jgi:small subunit ribosomal protein S5
VQDVVAKSTGTSNPHNMIKATFNALERINSPRTVASRRGLKVADVVGRRETVADAEEGEEQADV